MKKILFSVLAIFGISVVSCSSDSDAPANYANDIASTYEGYTNASSQFFTDMISENQTVVIEANNDGTANVKFSSTVTGNAVIRNATVASVTDGYVVRGTGESVISGHGDGGSKTYECNFTGKVGKDKKDAEFEFTLPSVMGGLAIRFIQGEAPAAMVVAGTYEGYTTASTAYFPSMVTPDEILKIVANENGTVSVTYQSATWGEAAISDATVSRISTGFEISGNGNLAMPGMNGGDVKNYACSLSGTIDGAKDNVELIFSVPSVMGGTSIKFTLGDVPEVE